MKRTIPLIVALAAMAFVPAHASHTVPSADCAISVDNASAQTPHIVDNTNDWNGFVTGNQGGLPDGDIYQQGTDITEGWISRDTKGLHANIQIANLGAVQPNSNFYFLFDYPNADPNQTRHWVDAQIKNYSAAVFSYGYYAPSQTAATSFTYYTTGATTGSITSGPNGVITMDIPSNVIDPATTGEYIINMEAQSSILLGSPEELPSPSPFKHGLVEPMDDTTDGTVCDATL